MSFLSTTSITASAARRCIDRDGLARSSDARNRAGSNCGYAGNPFTSRMNALSSLGWTVRKASVTSYHSAHASVSDVPSRTLNQNPSPGSLLDRPTPDRPTSYLNCIPTVVNPRRRLRSGALPIQYLSRIWLASSPVRTRAEPSSCSGVAYSIPNPPLGMAASDLPAPI